MRRGTLFSHRGQKSQTDSKVDRPPARLVVVGGVRFDGVDWVVRVGGVGRNRYINQDNQVYQTESKFDRHWWVVICDGIKIRPATGEAGRSWGCEI
jgi:hypothetical protein